LDAFVCGVWVQPALLILACCVCLRCPPPTWDSFGVVLIQSQSGSHCELETNVWPVSVMRSLSLRGSSCA
jgi:hypothetical protein